MTIRRATEGDMPRVFALRFEVFVDEQKVPREIELDAEDDTARHIIAEDGDTAVGCARILFHGDGSAHIGRLAVKKARRGEGIGAAICRFCIEECRAAGCTGIRLHGQLQAAGFYEKLGFTPHGEIFWEAGIEHREMVMHLPGPSAGIRTPRLLIRPVCPDDLTVLRAIYLDEDIKKTYMIPDFPSEEAPQRSLRRFAEVSQDETHFVRGIDLDGTLIGIVNDVEIDGGCMELGYALLPAYWNRGYATEMLAAVLDTLLGTRFSTIRAGAFAENPASLRVMEKCGMQRVAATESVEYRGVMRTCVYYEIRG